MSGINSSSARASVLGKGRCLRVLIFSWAFLFVIFVPWPSSIGRTEDFFVDELVGRFLNVYIYIYKHILYIILLFGVCFLLDFDIILIV